MTYGNGFGISYTYDVFGRTTKVKYNGVDQFSYVYDGNGNLFTFTDHENGVIYCYDYSSTGNLISEEQFTTGNAFLQGQYYTYNSYGDVASSTLKVAGQAPIKYICTYGYESSTSTQKLSVQSWKAKGSGYKVDYSYDGLGRATKQYLYPDLTGSSASSVLTRSYGYLVGANGNTTTLVSGLTYSGRSTSAYVYEYDARGNITAVYKGGTLQASYVYDDLNQLVRENNVTANKTWVYTYDIRGNILSRKTYAYTTGTLGTVQDTDTYEYFGQSSTYAWGDVLLRYDGIDYNVYDAIGNPKRYLNVNSSGDIYSFTWENGRQLASGTKGSTSFAYTYNADGLRTKKVVDGVTTEYYWAGSQLAMMIVNPDLPTEKVLKFYYDTNDIPMCLDFNGTIYYYITNLQGDVVALADQYGEVVTYEYDAWGKPISTYYVASPYYDAMQCNPLRYRGYIYDNETGFYYLQSRYYDPVVGRFINSDRYISTGQGFTGFNMFVYCNNNPVRYYDEFGDESKEVIYRIDDKGTEDEHIHVEYNGKTYSWYLDPKNKDSRHNDDLGYSDLTKTLKKHFAKKGVPKKYLNRGTTTKARIATALIGLLIYTHPLNRPNSNGFLTTPGVLVEQEYELYPQQEQTFGNLNEFPTVIPNYEQETYPTQPNQSVVGGFLVIGAICICLVAFLPLFA